MGFLNLFIIKRRMKRKIQDLRHKRNGLNTTIDREVSKIIKKKYNKKDAYKKFIESYPDEIQNIKNSLMTKYSREIDYQVAQLQSLYKEKTGKEMES